MYFEENTRIHGIIVSGYRASLIAARASFIYIGYSYKPTPAQDYTIGLFIYRLFGPISIYIFSYEPVINNLLIAVAGLCGRSRVYLDH